MIISIELGPEISFPSPQYTPAYISHPYLYTFGIVGLLSDMVLLLIKLSNLLIIQIHHPLKTKDPLPLSTILRLRHLHIKLRIILPLRQRPE
jgi:hypothetical protein